MHFDASELRGRDVYHLMTSLVVPRPIAWVGTRSVAGVDNLAPFSYFMAVSSKPPALAISVAHARDGLKDTARNILETGVFTVSMVRRAAVQPMVRTSLPYPPESSEFVAAGLTPVPGDRVAAPYPAEAGASMECRLLHTIEMPTTHLLVGEIVRFHLDDALLAPGEGPPRVDAAALDAVARLGGVQYAWGPEIVDVPAPPMDPPG